jgi:hypothetical protein
LSGLVKALASVRKLEIDTINSGLKRRELDHKGEALALEKKRYQRETTKMVLQAAQDEIARNIASSDLGADAKLEALGQHLFKEAW